MASKEMNDSLDLYQEFTAECARYPQGEKSAINYCVLGLTGEAGEVSDKWKKIIRDREGNIGPEERIELMYEVGDVLWYVARLSAHLGFRLSDVAHYNEFKLRDRVDRNVISGSGDTR